MSADYERGVRHGEDGIMFFPGPACKDAAGYKNGYIAGRKKYEKAVGDWPKTGESRWDKNDD